MGHRTTPRDGGHAQVARWSCQNWADLAVACGCNPVDALAAPRLPPALAVVCAVREKRRAIRRKCKASTAAVVVRQLSDLPPSQQAAATASPSAAAAEEELETSTMMTPWGVVQYKSAEYAKLTMEELAIFLNRSVPSELSRKFSAPEQADDKEDAMRRYKATLPAVMDHLAPRWNTERTGGPSFVWVANVGAAMNLAHMQLLQNLRRVQ